MRYIRDAITGALILRDQSAISKFSEKSRIESEIQVLRNEIHTLKTAVQELRSFLESIKESK
jgi:prefoldin subunit 5